MSEPTYYDDSDEVFVRVERAASRREARIAELEATLATSCADNRADSEAWPCPLEARIAELEDAVVRWFSGPESDMERANEALQIVAEHILARREGDQ